MATRLADPGGIVIQLSPQISAWDLEKKLRPPPGLRRRSVRPFHLERISFIVGSGESVAVLGRSGAGKTTLLRLLAGVYRPTGGTFRIDGRRSPILGGELSFSRDLTVQEYVRAYGSLASHRLDIDEVLAFSGLSGLERQPVRWLAEGQRARLCLTPGLLAPTDVYFIDDPLAICDPEYRSRAVALLRERLADGAVVMVAGQDLVTARAVCNRGLLLDDGKLITDAELDEAIAAFTTSVPVGPNRSAQGASAPLIIEAPMLSPVQGFEGEPVKLRFRLRGADAPFQLLVALKSTTGKILHATRTVYRLPHDSNARKRENGTVDLDVVVPGGSLSAGHYKVAASVARGDGVPLVTSEDIGVVSIASNGRLLLGSPVSPDDRSDQGWSDLLLLDEPFGTRAH